MTNPALTNRYEVNHNIRIFDMKLNKKGFEI